MTEDEFQQKIEQPMQGFLNSHMRMLAGVASCTAAGVIMAQTGPTKEQKLQGIAERFAEIHKAYGVDVPWDSLPDEIRQYRP